MFKKLLSLTALGALLFSGANAQQNEWIPEMDNTIYSDGDFSNGSGDHFIAGNTGSGDSRRALLDFSIINYIPTGSNIIGAEIELYCDQTNGAAGPQVINLHRVTSDWGEGSSNANANPGQGATATTGDATWACGMSDGAGGCMAAWTTPGGDVVSTPSASVTVDAAGQYYTIQSTAQLVADLQDMLDNPGTDYGFILVGNETANTTAKRFASREQNGSDFEPVIRVWYTNNAGPCSLADLGVTPTPATVICGGNVGVEVASSENGVEYYLQDPNTFDYVSGPVVGNGGTITLPVNVSSTSTYNVYAQQSQPSIGLDFDGVNQHVDFGNTLTTGLIGQSTITVEAWVNPSTTTGLGVIVGNYNYPINNNSMQFLLRRDNDAYTFWVDPGTGYTAVNSGAGTVTAGSWQHVAGVWDGSELRIYIDGTLAATSPGVTGSFPTNTNSVVIGGNSVNEFYQGQIDEVRIWATPRTEQEIDDNRFNCGLTNIALLASYNFEDGTGSSALTDNTGNGFNGTLVNMDPNTDWVNGSNVCGPFCSTIMSQQATITVDPITDQTVTATPDLICAGPGTSQIDVSSSENGIEYVLRDDATDAVVDGPISGNGSAISFSTGSISTTTTYNVLASKTAPSTGVELLGTSNAGILPQGNTGIFTDFTAEAWFQQTTPATYATDAPVFLAYNEVAGNPANAVAVYMDQATGTPYIARYDFAPLPALVSQSTLGTTNLQDGSFHHVALVANSTAGQYELYIDGAQEATLTDAITTWTGNFVGGLDVNTLGGLTEGTYDDIRMWSVTRTGTEIMNDMNDCLMGTETNLAAYWKADDGIGGQLMNSVSGSPFGSLGLGENNPQAGVDYNWTTGNTECVVCEQEMTDIVTVTVGDTEAPMMACQDVDVMLDATGNASITAADVDNGVMDNCDPTPSLSLDVSAFDCTNYGFAPDADLIITAVFDGDLSGGLPKGVELYVLNDIADLSEYGIGSANNGNGGGTEEFTFPSVPATAGDFIYVASESPQFTAFMGFAPDYTDNAASINGDDAIELFHMGAVIDVFGDVNVDGTNQPWEYADGWAYRTTNTGPDGTSFVLGNWTFSGPDALDGESDNATAATPVPVGTYAYTLLPTVVTLTATDADGNSGTCQANVNVFDMMAPTITNVPADQNVTANNAGCTAIVTWTMPTEADNCAVTSFTSTHNSGDAFPVGTTTVTYTAEDEAGNVTTESFDITVTNDLSASAAATDADCNGAATGAVDLTVTGGTAPYSYAWDNGDMTEDITVVAGTYNVDVTDANGCTANTNATVGEPSAISITVDAANDPTACGTADGDISITVTGGTVSSGYTYDWNSGAFTTEDITGLTGGNYMVTVTDDNGCMEMENVALSDLNAPTVALNTAGSSVALNCNGDANGSIDIDVTLNGGATSANYSWSNSETTEDITGLAAGTYSVTVTDDNNCATGATYDVTEPTVISINGMTTDATCNGGTDGAVDITVAGGTPGYTYDWNSGAFTTEDISSLAANAYDVTVTDANGCTETASFTVSEPAALSGTSTITEPTCNGDVDGAFDFTVVGGTAPYTYLWDDAGASTTEDLSNIAAGTYNVNITDGNGCTGTASVTVTEPAALTAAGTSTDEITGLDGTIDLTVTGGTASYTYAWTGPGSFTSTMEDPSGLAAGTYDVTVTDANGCTTTAQVIVGSQVGVVDVDGITLNVFPNPSNGMFTVTSSINSGQLIVRDALGREVTVININGNRNDINLEGHENGIYFLELSHEDTVKTIRIVLQK